MKNRASLLCVVCLFLAIHCGSGARVRSAPQFSGVSLKSSVLLVLPIAVTDDFGDERTGIVLDHESREQATKRACDSASDLRDDIKVLCFDRPELAKSSAFLKDLLLEYARDEAITKERWRELAEDGGQLRSLVSARRRPRHAGRVKGAQGCGTALH